MRGPGSPSGPLTETEYFTYWRRYVLDEDGARATLEDMARHVWPEHLSDNATRSVFDLGTERLYVHSAWISKSTGGPGKEAVIETLEQAGLSASTLRFVRGSQTFQRAHAELHGIYTILKRDGALPKRMKMYIDNTMCRQGRGCIQTLPRILRELGVEEFVFLERNRSTGVVSRVLMDLQ